MIDELSKQIFCKFFWDEKIMLSGIEGELP